MKMTQRQISKDQKFISFSQDDQVRLLVRKIAITIGIMMANLLLLFVLIFLYPSVIRNQTLWFFLLIFFAVSYLVILVVILIKVIAFFKYTNSLKEK
jgi:protein-S-isoprenylcysteine O-methyltransferase Ste14